MNSVWPSDRRASVHAWVAAAFGSLHCAMYWPLTSE